MSSSETSDDRWRLINVARCGRLEEVIKLSNKFSNDVKALSEALIGSCYDGHLDMVKWLVEYTAAVVNYNSEWYTPLLAACVSGHLDIVKYLVETCHADVNLPDGHGNISLTEACRYVRMPLSMYLLCEVSDLNVNVADYDGNTALHYAVWCSKDINTLLHKASGDMYSDDNRGDVSEVLRLVNEKGHKINVQDNNGNTPLHNACYNGHSDVVETLMLAGADETITNDLQITPAQVAWGRGHNKLLKLLDRDSLWQVLLDRRNKSMLSLVE